MKKLKRILKRLLAAGIILFVVLGTIWTYWNHLASARVTAVINKLEDRGLPARPRDLYPVEVPLEEDAAPFLRAAFELIHPHRAGLSGLREEAIWKEPPVELLEKFREPLRLVEIGVSRPKCNFEIEYEDGISMEVPHLVEIRQVIYLLRARAVARAISSDIDGALADLRTIFRCARCLAGDHLLVSQLVRFSICGIGLEALEFILPRLPAPARNVASLEIDNGAGGILTALQGEIVTFLHIRDLDTRMISSMGSHTGIGLWLAASRLGKPYARSDLAFWAEQMIGALDAVQEPYPRAIERASAIERTLRREGGVIVRAFHLGPRHFIESEARLAARTELAQLAADAYEFRREHGSLPESIDELGDSRHLTNPMNDRSFVLWAEEGLRYLAAPGVEGDDGEELRWKLE